MNHLAVRTRCLAFWVVTSIAFALSMSIATSARPGAGGATIDMPVLGTGETAWQIDGRVLATVTVGDTLYVGGELGWMHVDTGHTVQFDLATGAIRRPLAGIGGTNAVAYASASDGAGGWFVGGDELSVGGQPRGRLLHVLTDGSVSTWTPSLDGEVRSLVVANGVVYVAGEFGTVNGAQRRYLAAFDAGTGQLLPWDPAADGTVNSIAFGDGVVVAGGWFGSIGGRAQAYLAALDPVTGHATSWSPAVSYCVNCVGVRAGVVYFGGYFTAVGGQIRHYAAAVDAASGACTGWNPDVTPPPYEMSCGHIYVGAIAIDDTTVYLGGDFVAVGGLTRYGAAAISATSGRTIATWNPGLSTLGGMCNYPYVGSIAAGNGRVAMAGGFVSDYFSGTWNLLVVDARTAMPVGWNVGAYPAAGTVSIANGQLFLGGGFDRVDQWRQGLAAFDMKSGMLTPWNPSPSGTVRALAFDPVGRVMFAGGAFDGVRYGSNTNLAAFELVRGSPLPCPSTNGEVDALACDGNRLYVGGSFTAMGDAAESRKYLGAVRLRDEDRPLDDWAPSADEPVDVLVRDADGVLAGGAFTQIGGEPRRHLARLDPETGAALDWHPDPDGPVHAILRARDVVLVGGDFTYVAGVARPYLAAIDPASGVATTFDPRPDGVVRALGASGKAIFAGGSFQSIGGAPRRSLAALFASSGTAMPWTADADGDVFALLPLADQLIAGGTFTQVAGTTHHSLVGIALDDVGAAEVEVAAPPSRPTLAAPRPDPVRFEATIRFTLSETQRVTLAVYDVQGRLVERLLDRATLAAGTHDVAFSVRRWAPGLYLCRLRSDGGELAPRRFLVVH